MTRRLAKAATLALVAGVAAALGLAAADRAYGRPGAAVLLALAAVWLPCTLLATLLRRSR